MDPVEKLLQTGHYARVMVINREKKPDSNATVRHPQPRGPDYFLVTALPPRKLTIDRDAWVSLIVLLHREPVNPAKSHGLALQIRPLCSRRF